MGSDTNNGILGCECDFVFQNLFGCFLKMRESDRGLFYSLIL